MLAKLGEEVFRRLSLVPFVGAILVGILFGPGVLNLVNIQPEISLFLGLGINFLLFMGGAEEFDATRFGSMIKGRHLLLGLLEYFIRLAGVTTAVYLLTHDILTASVVGITASMTSAGPLTRLLSDTGLARTDEGTAIFSQVVFMEVAAVVTFSFVYDFGGRSPNLASVLIVGAEVVTILLGVVLFARYLMNRLLEKLEVYSKGREVVFAFIIAIILILGFAGQLTGFSSAMVALFLGFFMQPFLSARPVLGEKLRAFTYGFFEPLFFAGLGLYFVKISISLLPLTAVIFASSLGLAAATGALTSKAFGVNPLRNAFGTAMKGGVDSALLLTALTVSSGAVLINSTTYSSAALGIVLVSLVAPLFFRLRASVVEQAPAQGQKLIVKQHLENLTALEIANAEPTIAVEARQSLREAIARCVELGARGAVVLNERGLPVATFLLHDTLSLTKREISRLKVNEMALAEVVTVSKGEAALRLAQLFRETGMPVIAVTDDDGKLLGTIMEREILRRLMMDIDTQP